MNKVLHLTPLTQESFAPYGVVIEASGAPDFMINNGMCGRYHDLARPEFAGGDGAISLSVARSDPVELPLKLGMMERHPLGSQAFVPMNGTALIVTVAPDENGAPGSPVAFLSTPGQGIQYHANIWHGVLAPLPVQAGPSDFLIVDRVGDANNLVEHFFDTPFIVEGSE
jgi:ureidoglycolate lyase